MRTYALNSPQAAARLVALAMIADGCVSRAELDAARSAGAETELGLSPGELGAVLQTVCEDLLQGAMASGSITANIDDGLLRALLNEVDDPALRLRVAAAVVATSAADGHLSEGEELVLDAMRRHWGPQTVAARQSRAQRMAS